MTWFETLLSAEQKDVVDLVDSLVTSVSPTEGTGEHQGDGLADLRMRRGMLVESGLWSIGMAEELGGGGAPLDLRLTALVGLGAQWPALAWGCAQAHAAIEVLDGAAGFADLAADIVGGAAVCVVDQAGDHVSLAVVDGRVTGTLNRLDPAEEFPYVIVLAGDSTAWVLPPDALSSVRTVRTTGMAGTTTISAEVSTDYDPDTYLVTNVAVDEIRARLHLAGAAIASGLATEAARRSTEYSRTRVQFGAPLMELPIVRRALAAQIEQASESVAVLFAASDSSVTRSAAALSGNCERAIAVTAAALQSHGGYGYLEEFGVERLVRDAVSLRAAAGSLDASRLAATRLGEVPANLSVPFFAKEVNA